MAEFAMMATSNPLPLSLNSLLFYLSYLILYSTDATDPRERFSLFTRCVSLSLDPQNDEKIDKIDKNKAEKKSDEIGMKSVRTRCTDSRDASSSCDVPYAKVTSQIDRLIHHFFLILRNTH